MLCTEDVVRRLSAKYREEGHGQWRQGGWADVDVVDVGVRCVKGKGEMRHSFSKVLISV